jgi:hypothetical protein
MACGIDGRWGFAAWCANPSLTDTHTWIDHEPYPGKGACPTCGLKRARIHGNLTLDEKDNPRRRNRGWEGEHGWTKSARYGWVFRSWSLNRKADTYEELVATLDGVVVHEVREPLTLHLQKGSARRGSSTTLPTPLRRMTPEDYKFKIHVVGRGVRGWDALAPDPERTAAITCTVDPPDW